MDPAETDPAREDQVPGGSTNDSGADGSAPATSHEVPEYDPFDPPEGEVITQVFDDRDSGGRITPFVEYSCKKRCME